MKIIDKKLSEITPYWNNPRKNDQAVDKVAASIQEFGFKQPIVVDSNSVIIVGHTRYKAAQMMQLETVPVLVADDLDEQQVRAYRLADNKTSEFAEWNFDILDNELFNISDIDMSQFGFDIIDAEEEIEVIEDDYTEDVEPRTKLGDVWSLGTHRLICGDSTDSDTILKLMDGQKADLLVTDPPYNIDVEGKAGKIMNDNMDDIAFKEFLIDAFTVAFSALGGGAAFYIWHGDSEGLNFRSALKDIGVEIRQCLIWNKSMFTLTRQDYQWKHEPCLYGWVKGTHYFIDDRKQSTVIEDTTPNYRNMKKAELLDLLDEIYSDKVSTTVLYEKKPSISELHPTMKPVKLIARLIKNSSKPGWIVLDTFGGSGTTLIACEQLRRKCYMCELDPHYADVIIDRWEKLTGKQAVLVGSA